MELFSSSDVQRHSILLNRRCRTAPVDNGKLRRPTRCRCDSLFNFLFITHEGPPLQIAALPGGRWPGAAHLIPGKTKLKYLYLCIPCLQLVEKPGCTLRSNRVFGIFAEESVENQEMVLVVPPPCCQLFQVHGSKLKLHPVCHLCEASVSQSGGANQARVKSCTTISCDTAPHAAITITPSEACNNTSFHSTIFC